MKKGLLLIFFALFFLNESFAQFELNHDDSVNVDKIVFLLESKEVEFHNSIDLIPNAIFEWIKKENEGFSLADFNEEFNRTDVVDTEIPMRRVNFIASSGSYWVISYAHGGVGFHNHISLFGMKGQHVTNSWSAATLGKAENLEMVKRSYENGKIISHRYTGDYW